MDLPPPPPSEYNHRVVYTSEVARMEMRSRIEVVIYDGQIGNRRNAGGIQFFPSIGTQPSTFEMQISDRERPITLEYLTSLVQQNHPFPSNFVITQLIYRRPTHGPRGDIKFVMFELPDDEAVRSMVFNCQHFRDEVHQLHLCVRGRYVVDPVCTQLTPFSVQKTLTAIYHNGTIRMEGNGVRFHCADVKLCKLKTFCTFQELKSKILRKCRPRRHRLAAIYFRRPSKVGESRIFWTQMTVATDGDVECVFTLHNEHSMLGQVELYADFRRTTSEVLALMSPPGTSNDENMDGVDLTEP